MNELVTVRNTANGGVTKIRRSIAEHEVFGKHLEIVPDGTKPRVPLSKLVKDSKAKPASPKPAEVKPETDLKGEDD